MNQLDSALGAKAPQAPATGQARSRTGDGRDAPGEARFADVLRNRQREANAGTPNAASGKAAPRGRGDKEEAAGEAPAMSTTPDPDGGDSPPVISLAPSTPVAPMADNATPVATTPGPVAAPIEALSRTDDAMPAMTANLQPATLRAMTFPKDVGVNQTTITALPTIATAAESASVTSPEPIAPAPTTREFLPTPASARAARPDTGAARAAAASIAAGTLPAQEDTAMPVGQAAVPRATTLLQEAGNQRGDFAQWTALAAPADPRGVQPMPAATLAHPLTVDAPVGSARFADQAAQQVTWMAKNGIEHAEIRVKPAELGPITVRIEMHKNEAIISFAVTQPETRAAVENALHKLQEMLADSGISLGQTSVGGQSMAGEERLGTQSGRLRVVVPAGPHGDGTPAGLSTGNRAAHVAARGLVDTFA